MDWELVRQQVESALGIPVSSVKCSVEEWSKQVEENGGAVSGVDKNGQVYFFGAQRRARRAASASTRRVGNAQGTDAPWIAARKPETAG